MIYLRNAPRFVLLLMSFAFLMSSCSSTRSGSNANWTKKRPDTSTSTTSKSSKLRSSLTSYAHKFKGTKYVYGGGTPKGFDCSGLTHYVFDKFDVTIPRGSYNQAKVGKKISLSRAKPGDLIFFGKRGKVSHVAMVVRNTKSGIEVIHSTSSRGVIVENVSKSSYWKPRILFARDVLK